MTVGMRRRTRVVLIVSMTVVALVGAAGGVRVWDDANQREKTAEAFAAMRVVDRRINLPNVIPEARRTESGVEVRPLGEGPGPDITYSFNASATPDWRGRIDRAMDRAGYGSEGEPWMTRVHGWPVDVSTTDPSVESGGTAYLVISTR
jgi:hypothetical protein